MFRRSSPPPPVAGTIAEIPDGVVGEVTGTVEALPGRELLIAPITGRACVYFHIRVSDLKDPPRRLLSEERALPFALRDETGVALVDPDGARLELDSRRTGWGLSPRPEFMSDLAQRDPRLASARLDFGERIIAPGDRLVVIGRSLREPDPDPSSATGYRGGRTRLRISGSRKAELVLRDPAPGTVDKLLD